MNIIARLRKLCGRLEKREQKRQKELQARVINVPDFVKEMLDDTRAILNEPEQEENDTWNVEVSEHTYQLLMRERLGTDRSRKT